MEEVLLWKTGADGALGQLSQKHSHFHISMARIAVFKESITLKTPHLF